MSYEHDLVWDQIRAYAHDVEQPLVCLDELCRLTGVSDGTLRCVCHKFSGLPPAKYVRTERLKLARAMLFNSPRSSITVTQVATLHGFQELGRFAVNYHRMFGESPSATLRS